MHTFYEFFAGGGMARAGLGADWTCLFANDFDAKKVASYEDNWGPGVARLDDVNTLSAADLPGVADLVWASFPCQDLSLAGAGAGLKGQRSGTFWPFWERIKELIADGRKPKLIALENVTGMLSSHGGRDFEAICSALFQAGYLFGAVMVDAAHFVPQSRKRVFIVAISSDCDVSSVAENGPLDPWHSKPLIRAAERLPADLRKNWIWWRLPAARVRNEQFADLFERTPAGVAWHTAEETDRLVRMMAPRHRAKLENAVASKSEAVGTLYRRTRPTPEGGVQRAEVRFDGTAGCLRTPAGGSSRQIVVYAGPDGIRSRLISPREAARLMGLPEGYRLPTSYNDCYHLLGDGLAVPAVRFIATHLLTPLMAEPTDLQQAA